MNTVVECPQCRQAYRVKLPGASPIHCKRCGHEFTITVNSDDTFRTGNASPGFAATASFEGIGERLGQYAIIRKLGAGAMGEVWLAHDMALKRDVAIKVLPPAIAADLGRRKRFIREARLAARLNHPNAVTIYQICSENDRLYIAMEFVDGKSLDQIVGEQGPLDWLKASQAIRDAASALQVAHEMQLVHRDIKPGNLMYSTKGVTKVVDFGLARSQSNDTQLTQDGRVVGTPAYMSPEQWQGGALDGRSDIYSLVCTYYFLLTGKAPYEAPSFAKLSDLHRRGAIPDPLQRCPDLPPAIGRIMARGAAKDPAQRYQTAAELIGDLDALMANPQAFKGPNSSHRPRRRWVTRAFVGAIFVALVASGVAAMLTIISRRPLDAPTTTSISAEVGELVRHRVEWPADVELPPTTSFRLADGAPGGAYFSSELGELFWRANQSGSHEFTILASIPGSAEGRSTTFKIDVAPILAPTLPSSYDTLPIIPDRTVNEGAPLEFAVFDAAVLRQHGPLHFALQDDKPSGATIDERSGVFHWTPGEKDDSKEPHCIKLSVSRSGSATQETVKFFVNVREVNSKPELDPIRVGKFAAGAEVEFDVSAKDDDLPRNQLTYSVSPPTLGASIDDSGKVSWKPKPSDLTQSHSLTIRVTDSGTPPAYSEQSVAIDFKEACDEFNPEPLPKSPSHPGAVAAETPFALVRNFDDLRQWKPATCGAISPAVKYAATAQGSQILLWNLAVPSKPLVLSGLTNTASEIIFSPDDSLLMATTVSANGGQLVLVWEARDGRLIFQKDGVWHARFGAGERQIAYMKSTSKFANYAYIESVSSAKSGPVWFPIDSLPQVGAEGPWKFSPDGRFALIRWSGWLKPPQNKTWRNKHGIVQLYDLVEQKRVNTWECRTDLCEFSADSKVLAIIEGQNINYFNTQTGHNEGTLLTTAISEFMTFSPRGDRFAAGEASTVQIWKWPLAGDSKPLHTINLGTWDSTLRSHASEDPTSLTFSSDGKWLIIDHLEQDLRRSVQVWSASDAKLVTMIDNYEPYDLWATDLQSRSFISARAHGATGPKGVTVWEAALKKATPFDFQLPIAKVAVDPRGQPWAMLGSGELWRFNAQQPEETPTVGRTIGWRHVQMTSQGGKILALANDGEIATRDVEAAKPAQTLPYQNFVPCPIGRLCVSMKDKDLVLWNLDKDTDNERVLHGTGAAVVAVNWDPDGRQVASLDANGSIHLWDVEKGGSVKFRSPDATLGASLSLARQSLAIAVGGEVRIWDIAGSAAPTQIRKLDERLKKAYLSPDGNYLATVSDKGQVRLWNLAQKTDQELWPIQEMNSALRFSPDGRLLISSDPASMRFWNIQAGKEEFTVPNSVNVAGALRSDSKVLATVDATGKLRLWDIQTKTNRQIELPSSSRSVASVCFSPTGRYLTMACSHGSIQIFKLTEATNTTNPTGVTGPPAAEAVPAATGVVK